MCIFAATTVFSSAQLMGCFRGRIEWGRRVEHSLVAQKSEDKVASIVDVFRRFCSQNTFIEEITNDPIDGNRAVLDGGFCYTKEGASEKAPVRFGRTMLVVRMEDVEYMRWKLG